MSNRGKRWKLKLPLPLFPKFQSFTPAPLPPHHLPLSTYSEHHRAWGMGCYSLSIPVPLCFSFLLHFPLSPGCSPAWTTPVWVLSTRLQSFRKKSALLRVVHRLQCGYPLWRGPLHKLQGNAFSTVVLLMAYRWISAPAPAAHLFCPHPCLTWVITLLFLTVSGVCVCLVFLFICFSSSSASPVYFPF